MYIYIFLALFILFQQFIYNSYTGKITRLNFGERVFIINGSIVENILILINSVVFAMLFFLRSERVGTDYISYLYLSDVLSTMSFEDTWEFAQNTNMESFFVFVTKVIENIFSDSYIVMLVWYILFLIFLVYFIKKESPNILLSFWIFYSWGMFNQSLNIMRQYLAVGILLVGVVYLSKKNIHFFLIAIVLAFFLHHSAVVAVLLYIAYLFRKNARMFSLSIVFGSVLLFLYMNNLMSILGTVLGGVFDKYTGYDNFDGSSGIGLVVNSIIFLFYYIFYDKVSKDLDSAYIWLCSASLVLGMNIISMGNPVMSRLVIYFKIMLVASIPCYFNYLFKGKREKFIALNIVAIISGIYYISLMYATNLYETIPYIIRNNFFI